MQAGALFSARFKKNCIQPMSAQYEEKGKGKKKEAAIYDHVT